MSDDRVMDAEDRKTYITHRKLHREKQQQEEQMRNLRAITLHHGYRSEARTQIFDALHLDPMVYTPEKSWEKHFYLRESGHLHVVNPRGVTRRLRDLDQAAGLEEVVEHPVAIYVNNFGVAPGDPDSRIADRRFVQFADETVDKVFEGLNLDEVAKQGRLTVMMGPHTSLPPARTFAEDMNSDYLNYKILLGGDEHVVAFDYVFADQAMNILSQMFLLCNARFSGLQIDVMHYGKVGILNPAFSIGDICVPHGALEESKLRNGFSKVSPIHNALWYNDKIKQAFEGLIGDVTYGQTINTTSVLRQRKSDLTRDLDAGGDYLDMEWSCMAGLDHGTSSKYPQLGRVRYFFAGVGSDKPLAGKNLANTTYPFEREQQLAQAYLRMIGDGVLRAA